MNLSRLRLRWLLLLLGVVLGTSVPARAETIPTADPVTSPPSSQPDNLGGNDYGLE